MAMTPGELRLMLIEHEKRIAQLEAKYPGRPSLGHACASAGEAAGIASLGVVPAVALGVPWPLPLTAWLFASGLAMSITVWRRERDVWTTARCEPTRSRGVQATSSESRVTR